MVYISMTYIFNAHGEFTLDIEDDLLVLRAHGDWNKEASLKLQQQVQAAVNNAFNGQDFYILVCVTDWFPTHDSLAILSELTHWGLQNGLRAEALCIQGKLASEVIFKEILPIETDGYQRDNFSNEYAARDWLTLLRKA